MINKGLDQLTEYLRARNLIDDALFIDGTKILADADGFVRYFKEYQVEKMDANQMLISEALTPKENLRKITVNPSWEYHKEKQKERLSTPKIQKIYGRRKIDVKTVFGFLKACLGFTRYTVRSLEKVRKQTGLLITAINMMKLTKIGT